jgi:hypothetical protein
LDLHAYFYSAGTLCIVLELAVLLLSVGFLTQKKRKKSMDFSPQIPGLRLRVTTLQAILLVVSAQITAKKLIRIQFATTD